MHDSDFGIFGVGKSGTRLDTPEDKTDEGLVVDEDEEFDEDMCSFENNKVIYEDFYLGETFEFDPETNEFTFESEEEGKEYIYTGEELLWMKEIRKRYGNYVPSTNYSDTPEEDESILEKLQGLDELDRQSVIKTG